MTDCRICGHPFEQPEPLYLVCLTCHAVVLMKAFPRTTLFARPIAGSPVQLQAETLDAIEKRAIMSAFRVAGGDHSAAARLLGISRTTVYRKLREYGQVELGVAA